MMAHAGHVCGECQGGGLQEESESAKGCEECLEPHCDHGEMENESPFDERYLDGVYTMKCRFCDKMWKSCTACGGTGRMAAS